MLGQVRKVFSVKITLGQVGPCYALLGQVKSGYIRLCEVRII
jgi:hypothetical protein